MDNLTRAADRLVRQLRACPVDDIVERLEQRTAHADQLHTRLQGAWSSARARLEALTAQVEAEAERVQQRNLAFMEALQALAPRLSQLAQQLEPAFDQATREIKASESVASAAGKGLDERLAKWSPAAADGVIQTAETQGKGLVDALARMSAILRDQVHPSLQRREAVAQQFLDLAKTQGVNGVKGLGSHYEEWCVRLSEVEGTVEKQGADRLPAHAEEVVAASIVDVERLVESTFETVEATVGSGVEALAQLRTIVEAAGEGAEEQLSSLRERAEQVARGFEWGLPETQAAAERLSIFAEQAR
jgi:chromosome segregation ATPase